MIISRPNLLHRFGAVALLRRSALGLLACLVATSSAGKADEPPVGRMLTIRGTINSDLVQRVQAAIRDAIADDAEVLIFDLQATPSDFGACYDLAARIEEAASSVRMTVAYIGQPLSGNPVLVALACKEIAMAEDATIGNVDEFGNLKSRDRELFESISIKWGHGSEFGRGLADKNVALFEVTTPEGKMIKTSEGIAELERRNISVLKKEVLKEAGQTWTLSGKQAHRLGLAKRICNSRKEVATAYDLPEQTAAEDATLRDIAKPCLLRIDGIVNAKMEESIRRRLKDAASRGCTLLFVEITASDGDVVAASGLMEALGRFGGHTVAWVPTKATGPAMLVVFGCDELVVGTDAQVGGFQIELSEEAYAQTAESAVETTKESKFPSAVVRGMIDRAQAVWEVHNKSNPALREFRTEAELETEAVAKDWEKDHLVKPAGVIWELSGAEAVRSVNLAVDAADSREELFQIYSIHGAVPVLEPNWVDGLMNALRSPGATVFLLVVGLTCLYIEFQMPGFGLAGLFSAVCFVLFFWARFLSETANSLEIVMFVLGLIFLAIELFVLPGFGVTGVAGVCLMLASLVLASQSFVLPSTETEVVQLAGNLGQIFGSMIVFFILAVTIAKYFPSLPVFGRMVLPPPGEMDDEIAAFVEEEEYAESHLVGAVGVAASPLRPAGRMKLEDRYYDVLTLGEFIEPGSPIEVIEAFPNRIVVRASRRV